MAFAHMIRMYALICPSSTEILIGQIKPLVERSEPPVQILERLFMISHHDRLGDLFKRYRFFVRFNGYYESSLPTNLIRAVEADNAATIEITNSLIGKHLAITLVKYLFCRKACNILTHQLTTVETFINPTDILFFCVSSMPSRSIVLIDALESRHPGIVASDRDMLGNNALWYLFYRTRPYQPSNDNSNPSRSFFPTSVAIRITPTASVLTTPQPPKPSSNVV